MPMYDADVKFQRYVWTAQRVGWIIIGLVVAAAMAGLFGTGPLSRASAQGPGVQIDYERFGRWQQPMKLRCFLSATTPDMQIALSRQYLESVQVEEIIPRTHTGRSCRALGGSSVHRPGTDDRHL
jgi:hypothetical protein